MIKKLKNKILIGFKKYDIMFITESEKLSLLCKKWDGKKITLYGLNEIFDKGGKAIFDGEEIIVYDSIENLM